MYIYIYIYVCIYIYVYICIYMYIYVYIYVYICIYTYICMYVCMYVYIYMYVCLYLFTYDTHVYLYMISGLPKTMISKGLGLVQVLVKQCKLVAIMQIYRPYFPACVIMVN